MSETTQLKREEVEVSPLGDFAGELAKYATDGGHASRSFVQSLSGGRVEDVRVIGLVPDHHDLLETAGDLLAEHLPERVPDRDEFEVVSVDISVDDRAGTVEIERNAEADDE